jgi:hypothetical protein
MGVDEVIDITFDFRSDTPLGRDPDARSPTLQTYYQLLSSKLLPSGAPFERDFPLRTICTTARSSASSACQAMR